MLLILKDFWEGRDEKKTRDLEAQASRAVALALERLTVLIDLQRKPA